MKTVAYDPESDTIIERDMTEDELASMERIKEMYETQSKLYRLGKSTPWRRMTDDEAVNVKDQISKQPVRMQMIYDAAAYLDTGDELFVQISNLLTALFGKARADELLAPE